MFESKLDQAAGLRRLFAQRNVRVLPLISLDGGGDQIGFVVNLAAALAQLGQRTLLLDAERGQVAPLLGLRARYDLIHLLSGDCRFKQVALRARDGFWVMPAVRGLADVVRRNAPARDLFAGFGNLPEAFDTVLAYAPAPVLVPLLSGCAQDLTLISGTEAWQVAQVYGQIKALHASYGIRRFRLVYCRATSPAAAATAHERLASASGRFLGVDVMFCGVVEDGRELAAAERSGTSVFSVSADSDAARAFRRIATLSLDWPLPEFAGQADSVH
ncbi:MAG: hypothetical protein QM674_02510 [Burkholderiaceae bacterium]